MWCIVVTVPYFHFESHHLLIFSHRTYNLQADSPISSYAPVPLPPCSPPCWVHGVQAYWPAYRQQSFLPNLTVSPVQPMLPAGNRAHLLLRYCLCEQLGSLVWVLPLNDFFGELFRIIAKFEDIDLFHQYEQSQFEFNAFFDSYSFC